MQFDDQTFLTRFATRDLGPEHFDHFGHLRIAWLHLTHYPLEDAIERVCGGIRELARRFGVPQKYHHTLTVALLQVMNSRIKQSHAQNLDALLQDHPLLQHDAHALVAEHYSSQRLNSDSARLGWLPPDLKPFDIER